MWGVCVIQKVCMGWCWGKNIMSLIDCVKRAGEYHMTQSWMRGKSINQSKAVTSEILDFSQGIHMEQFCYEKECTVNVY